MSCRPSLFALMLAGCYASHPPWESAAPDGSAVSLRVDLGNGLGAHGFLEIRFDGTYAASPVNDLRVCTGVLPDAELAQWVELIDRTDAFELRGHLGNDVLHAAGASVTLASEEGLSTSFNFAGGGSIGGYDPALREFRDKADAFLHTLDIEACAPKALDMATTSLIALVAPIDVTDDRSAWIEVDADGTVEADIAELSADLARVLEPCAPLAAREPLWEAVMASAPFDMNPPSERWRYVGAIVETTVTLPDHTTHERSVSFRLQPSRREHVALEQELLHLVYAHCLR